jgi:hypothetical protein
LSDDQRLGRKEPDMLRIGVDYCFFATAPAERLWPKVVAAFGSRIIRSPLDFLIDLLHAWNVLGANIISCLVTKACMEGLR